MTFPRITSTLKVRRIELGLTQQQLADKLGVRQSNVSQIESGEKGPSIWMLMRYCKALKLARSPDGAGGGSRRQAPAPADP